MSVMIKEAGVPAMQTLYRVNLDGLLLFPHEVTALAFFLNATRHNHEADVLLKVVA